MPYDDRYPLCPFSVSGDAQGQLGSGCCGPDGKHCLAGNGAQHICCAESRKMQKAMDLDGLDLCKLLEVNDSATNMVHAVANLELVLKDKLEFVSNNLYVPGDSGCPSPAQ